MSKMFNMQSGQDFALNLDLSNFDMSCVEDIDSMFYGCSKLTGLNLNNWNISKAKNYTDVLANCKINGVLVNRQNITDWNWNTGDLTEEQIATMF